jgi:hypothetical protein
LKTRHDPDPRREAKGSAISDQDAVIAQESLANPSRISHVDQEERRRRREDPEASGHESPTQTVAELLQTSNGLTKPDWDRRVREDDESRPLSDDIDAPRRLAPAQTGYHGDGGHGVSQA